MLQQDLEIFTEILRRQKRGPESKLSLAIVKGKVKDLICLYDPKLQKDIRVQRELFGTEKINNVFYSCSVGDVVEYDPTSSDNSIVENLTLRHKLEAFREAYFNTYER